MQLPNCQRNKKREKDFGDRTKKMGENVSSDGAE